MSRVSTLSWFNKRSKGLIALKNWFSMSHMDKTTRYYRLAVYSFVLPFAFLGLFMIDSWTFGLTNSFFLALFSICLLPAGIIGLFFNYKGYRIAHKEHHNIKKDIGYANFIMGLIILFCGVLGFGIAYVMTS